MLEINVKTIDGQNRSFSIADDHTVRQFKEKISTSLEIPIDRQRLIFQGRELKDTSNLSEFDINGKTIHLVQRALPTSAQPPVTSDGTTTNTRQSTETGPIGDQGTFLLFKTHFK
jgi:large proline-rich protein BAG6